MITNLAKLYFFFPESIQDLFVKNSEIQNRIF
jgi:hypothetical protein